MDAWILPIGFEDQREPMAFEADEWADNARATLPLDSHVRASKGWGRS